VPLANPRENASAALLTPAGASPALFPRTAEVSDATLPNSLAIEGASTPTSAQSFSARLGMAISTISAPATTMRSTPMPLSCPDVDSQFVGFPLTSIVALRDIYVTYIHPQINNLGCGYLLYDCDSQVAPPTDFRIAP
jgi:hypothetical protein